MKDINHEEFERLTVKDIQDTLVELFEEMGQIGEIEPGWYKLPGGGYTNKKGWEFFMKTLNEKINESSNKNSKQRKSKGTI